MATQDDALSTPKRQRKAKVAQVEPAPASTEVPASTEAPVATAGPRRPLRIAAIAGMAVLGVATLYLLAMTVLWGVHHHSLTSSHAELADELAAQHAIVNSQAADLTAGEAKLDDALAELSDDAKQRANAQDYEVLFRGNSTAMLACANERIEVVRDVKNRGAYITWTLHRYDDEVASYCDEILGYFNDNIASEESL